MDSKITVFVLKWSFLPLLIPIPLPTRNISQRVHNLLLSCRRQITLQMEVTIVHHRQYEHYNVQWHYEMPFGNQHYQRKLYRIYNSFEMASTVLLDKMGVREAIEV